MADVPTWAGDARAAALKSLETLPELTGTEEEWRFTPPAKLALDGRETPAPGIGNLPSIADESPRAVRMTLTDGAAATPEVFELPDGVIVAELSEALATHEDLVRKYLYTLVGFETRPGALNAARWEAGTFVYVPKGVEVKLPIETLLTATGAEGTVVARTLVVLEEGARATVIDRYMSPDLSGAVQASSVAELIVAPGAELEHIAYVDWGAGVNHHLTVTATADRDSRARSVVVSLGGDTLRVEPTVRCIGPDSDARALGLFFASGDQHFEHRVIARHEAPNTYGNLLYKGALKDNARTIFFGNLIVPPGSPGTDAYQTNRNLLLSETAAAETIPFLEIESSEVKCSHAGAVGRVDDEHLFYLQSRGVPEADAKQLIVLGFLQEVLEMVALDEVRHELEEAVARKLGVEVPAS